MGRHDLDEFAAFQMRSDVVSRYLDQAETGETAGDIGLGIVDGDAAAHGKRMQRLAFDPFPVFHPPAGGRRVIDRPMAGKIVGLRSPTVRGKLKQLALMYCCGARFSVGSHVRIGMSVMFGVPYNEVELML